MFRLSVIVPTFESPGTIVGLTAVVETLPKPSSPLLFAVPQQETVPFTSRAQPFVARVDSFPW
jgi:hypothetical protein